MQYVATQLNQSESSTAVLAEYDKMLYLLARHKKDLKNIQSRAHKNRYKQQIFPDYQSWLEGVLTNGNGRQDDVLMNWLIWAIDIENFELALRIGEYALRHSLVLPEGFVRTTATAIAEEIADSAMRATATGQAFDIAILQRAAQMTADQDMPDQSRARLLKELGLMQLKTAPEAAKKTITAALLLNPRIGLKTVLRKLNKQQDNAKSEVEVKAVKKPRKTTAKRKQSTARKHKAEGGVQS